MSFMYSTKYCLGYSVQRKPLLDIPDQRKGGKSDLELAGDGCLVQSVESIDVGIVVVCVVKLLASQ